MKNRRNAAIQLAAVLAFACSAAPAAASPSNGGATPAPGASTTPPAPTVPVGPPVVPGAAGVLGLPAATLLQVGNPIATASGTGIQLISRQTAMLRSRVHLTGSAPAGQTLTVQRQDPVRGWVSVATATARATGSFDTYWKPTVLGPVALRAVPGTPGVTPATTSTSTTAGTANVGVTVFRPGVATWYSARENGTETACGVRLTRTTMGVAHKTLPCGTEVEFYWHGRSIVVPVIDRGPYAKGVSWDLTKATNAALKGTGRVTVGAIPLPQTTTTPLSAPPTP